MIVFEVVKQNLAVSEVSYDLRKIVVGPSMQCRRRERGAD
jgi:hypothetical protein